jgi:hypothetical protein
MAYLVLLFLDLGLPIARNGDDSLYRQAMIDHHLKGPITTNGNTAACRLQGVPLADSNTRSEALFSRIAWDGNTAWLQINASDATWCSLYRKSGASYRLVRELRLPDATR